MNKFIKLTAIEFYDKDSVYTEIFEDYTRFMRFQRITEPVYRRLGFFVSFLQILQVFIFTNLSSRDPNWMKGQDF